MVPFDWQAHDTYFIVAHLHYVLIGGMVFPLFAAFYYWTPMISRPAAVASGSARWVFWLMFVGMQVTFLPMHLTGLMGMPRRVYTYLPGRDWEVPNMISTVGAFMHGGRGAAVPDRRCARNFRFTVDDDAGNVYRRRHARMAADRATTRRASIPVVNEPRAAVGRSAAGRGRRGRALFPARLRHRRCARRSITSPLRAEPQYLQIMPGPSAWPLLAALFTAGFFLLLTVQAYCSAVVCGVLAVLCVLRWLWETDRQVQAEAGRRRRRHHAADLCDRARSARLVGHGDPARSCSA